MTSVLGSEEKFEILDSFLTEIYIFFREDKIQIFEYFEFSTTNKNDKEEKKMMTVTKKKRTVHKAPQPFPVARPWPETARNIISLDENTFLFLYLSG
jgi:hypothetical protein